MACENQDRIESQCTPHWQETSQDSLFVAPIHEQPTRFPRGWPTSPEVIKFSVVSDAGEIALDLVLIALSIVFLMFGIIVRQHDRDPVSLNQPLTDALLNAAKYVGDLGQMPLQSSALTI